jgi:Flp pilus assembly protein CpaB
MADEIVWNKKLLVISLVLGLLAAIVFLAYDHSMRKKLTGDTVQVLVWRRSVGAGSPVAMKDIEIPTVRRSLLKKMEGVLQNQTEDLNLLKGETYLSRKVYKGDFVRYTDILGKASASPSGMINENMRAVTLRVDPSTTPGELLGINDRVDIIGLLAIGGKPIKAYTVLENVRVLAVGGRSASPDEDWDSSAGGRQRPSLRTYRSVTIEVSQATAEKLAELLPRIQGRILLSLRPPPRGPEAGAGGRINPEIEPIFKQPLPEDLSGR